MKSVKCKMMAVAAKPFRTFTLYILHFTLFILLGGCTVDGPKIVEGTDLSVGISVPGSEGVYELTFFNWLSGFKCQADDNSRVKLRYTCAETNDYFGVVSTRVYKTVDAEITPVVDEAEDGGEASRAEGANPSE